MANNVVPFNALERDIDLLLLEEMHCSAEFVCWIARRAGIEEATLLTAEHSVYKENGETDVLAVVESPDGRVALMIEDKIGAAMQPKQAARYHVRGEQLCAADPTIKEFKTLLCAPKSYLASVPPGDWHTKLPLEDIADWFAKQEGPRSVWRREILMQAVRRQRRSAIGSDGITDATHSALFDFKRNYHEHVFRTYPGFRSTEQPGSNREFHFYGRDFPTYIALKHQFTRSEIILIFENHWIDVASIALSGSIFDENMWIASHPKALHLAVGVEPIDFTEPFAGQVDLVDLALEAARRLMPYASMVQQASG